MKNKLYLLLVGLFLLLFAGIVTAMPSNDSELQISRSGAGEVSYIYSAKFVCGMQNTSVLEKASVVPGLYSTEINIHNFSKDGAEIQKRVLPLVLSGASIGREPQHVGVRATDFIALPPDTATMDDCQRLAELLYEPNIPVTLGTMPTTIGFLEIISPVPLHIDAVYTTLLSPESEFNSISIDVERVEGTAVTP